MISAVTEHLEAIAHFGERPPPADFYDWAEPLLGKLLEGVAVPTLPAKLFCAAGLTADDYRANWHHQVWYHFGELARIAQGRRDRAHAQGGDSWVNAPAPAPDQELASHLNELAKLRGLIRQTPDLAPAATDQVLLDDPLLDKPGQWQGPDGPTVQRDATNGVCWQGQNPGGDWMWHNPPLPDAPLRIAFDIQPISTIKGGLIIGLAAKPLSPGTPLAVASGPKMSDYYKNFDAYHFSVHRGSSGYCNLRRCGPGLVMLASFGDPCSQYGRWYRIEIIKAHSQVELRVDGKLVVCYVDMGFICPPLAGGHFGLRHFQGYRGWHRNLSIATIK